jgi:hypothetical protein
VVGGAILVLLLGGCCLVMLSLRDGGWVLMVGGCLIEVASMGMNWLTGSNSGVGTLFRAVKNWLDRRCELRAERKYREIQAWQTAVLRLGHLEERLNELDDLRIEQRLAKLERTAELRTYPQWPELREFWRVLILDPDTPEELRASCREWLAKHPDALVLPGGSSRWVC